MSELVTMTTIRRIGVITIDNPPVNALSPGVPEGVRNLVKAANADERIDVIVVMGAGATFVAGADINEFAKVASGQAPPLNLRNIFFEIESSAKPLVMALNGTALGGGLELAMSGHYRVLVPTAKVGQPEVNLGLIPGAGGTQRLPRLAGIAKALEMCALGQPISAQEALAAGIADRIASGDIRESAVAFAEEIAGVPFSRSRNRTVGAAINPADLEELHGRARKSMRGRNAPAVAIQMVTEAVRVPFEEGCRIEAELFEQCLKSAESRGLIHAFFGEREVGKIPGLAKNTPALTIAKAGVIGAGTMGSGIAMVYANAGIPVRLREVTQEALDRGMNSIRKNYASTVAKGRLSQPDMDTRLALITPQLGYEGFEELDVITEAVFEQMEAKKKIFAEIHKVAKPDCILASNTSTLDIDEIASVTSRPEMVVGHHFFSPANIMRLLEVVRGKATSDSVLVTSMALAKRLKKVAVLSGNARGFIGNRILHPYIREAQFLVEEGATVEEVNEAIYDFGMPMGPLAMCDLIGLDVEFRIHQESRLHHKPGIREPFGIDLLYAEGRYGQKNGKGFSNYVNGRQPEADPAVTERIQAAAKGLTKRSISRQEIVDRCILAMVNEGARVLEAGTAMRAVDIDVVYLTGYGFPTYRGGLMFYADEFGLDRVLSRIEEFRAAHGDDLWAPAPLLTKLVTEGKTFSSLGPVLKTAKA